MNRVPADLDQLMWAVAENPTPSAMDEFAARYPSYRSELLKRIEMVRALRQQVNGGAQNRTRPIPKFQPQPTLPSSPARGMGIALGMLTIAVAFAAVTYLTASKPHPPPNDLVLRGKVIEAPLPTPVPVYVNPPVQAGHWETLHGTSAENPQAENDSGSLPSVAVENEIEEQPRDLRLKDVSIVDALKLITSNTRINLVVGPGFVNQKVTLDFHQKNTVEMLRQMAKDYAFTLSDEGDGTFLVLPVPDTTSNEDSEKSKEQALRG